MYTKNFKKHFGILFFLVAIVMSGCQQKDDNSKNESASASSLQSTESSHTSEDSFGIGDNSQGNSQGESSDYSSGFGTPEQSSSSSEYIPPGPDDGYSADRVWADDEVVPDEWLRVDSRAVALTRVNENIDADTSGDPESAIPALMNKNLLFFEMIYEANAEEIIKFDWNEPYYSDGFEEPIYPVTSEYFPDVQSIYDFAYDVYKPSAVEWLFFGTDGNPQLFVEENGISYLNVSKLPNWSDDPFYARSYIEITDKTDNKCTFIWHYADREMLNPPESGYEYYYFDKTYIAEYIDGSWKLNRIIFNNEDQDI